MYIFRKEFKASGWLEECIYDSNPEMGSYSHPISKTFKENQLLEADEVRPNKFKLYESEYGVSLYESSEIYEIPIKKLLTEGILEEISENEFEKVKKLEELKETYQKASFNTEFLQSIIEDNLDVITEKAIDELVASIIAETHARADYIIAALSM